MRVSDQLPEHAAQSPTEIRASLLAVGDVNLGRRVGQILLGGDTLYPWQAVRDTFARYDIVFANLESNLSDQNGKTVDPRSNVVFTGPPRVPVPWPWPESQLCLRRIITRWISVSVRCAKPSAIWIRPGWIMLGLRRPEKTFSVRLRSGSRIWSLRFWRVRT